MRSVTAYFSCASLLVLVSLSLAFSPIARRQPHHRSTPGIWKGTVLSGATTVEPPTRERTDTDRDTRTGGDDSVNDRDDDDLGDLEYLIDQDVSREMDDPFHILLLGSTFEKPKITVNYVSGSLEYVLSMPSSEAQELSQFAKEEGMSCLGTWPREECLSYGKQLQRRDLVCRVVPYCEGGQRGWQAKDAGSSSSSNNNNANNFA